MPRRYDFTRLAALIWKVAIGVEYSRVCAFESLYAAHKKARHGKRGKRDVVTFEMNLADNLWRIKEQLENGSYRVAGYNRFMIYDPKEREIQALSYTDRIVQCSLCDEVLTPFVERRLIYDNCACRIGKGTHFGMKRLSGFLQEHYKTHGANGWILKADIRKYFPSIPHEGLLKRLRRIIPDPDVMTLLEHIIYSYNGEVGKGLPMGNQTSQLFALYYLDPVDRLIKETLRVKHYSRYMDDMVLLHPDKSYLQLCLREIRKITKEMLGLELNEKTQIMPLRQGVDYLGWHFYLTDTGKVVRRLRSSSKRRMISRIKVLQREYQDGAKDWTELKQSLASMRGHVPFPKR